MFAAGAAGAARAAAAVSAPATIYIFILHNRFALHELRYQRNYVLSVESDTR